MTNRRDAARLRPGGLLFTMRGCPLPPPYGGPPLLLTMLGARVAGPAAGGAGVRVGAGGAAHVHTWRSSRLSARATACWQTPAQGSQVQAQRLLAPPCARCLGIRVQHWHTRATLLASKP